MHGKLDHMGLENPSLPYSDVGGARIGLGHNTLTDVFSASRTLITWFESHGLFDRVSAVGHRPVHCVHHVEPEIVTPSLLEALHGSKDIAPDHLSAEIVLIEALQALAPALQSGGKARGVLVFEGGNRAGVSEQHWQSMISTNVDGPLPDGVHTSVVSREHDPFECQQAGARSISRARRLHKCALVICAIGLARFHGARVRHFP
jgi:Acetokinase family